MPQKIYKDDEVTVTPSTPKVFKDSEVTPVQAPDSVLRGSSKPSELKPSSTADYYLSKAREWIMPVTRSAGNTVGMAIGAGAGAASPIPGGTVLGAGIGGVMADQLYQGAQSIAPSIFGERQNKELGSSLGESAVNTGFEAVGNKVAKIPGKVIDHTVGPQLQNLYKQWQQGTLTGETFKKSLTGPLKDIYENWLAKKLKGNATNEEIEAMTHAPADLNLSAGQVTNSKGLQQVEDLFGRTDKKHNITQPAQAIVKREVNQVGKDVSRRSAFTLEEPYTVRAQNAQQLAKGQKAGIQQAEDNAFEDFRNNYKHLQWTTSAVKDPATGAVSYQRIDSPILLNHTQQAAKEIVAITDKMLADPTITAVKETAERLESMRSAAAGFAGNLPTQVTRRGIDTGNPVVDWEKAKLDRGVMYDIYNKLEGGTKTKELTGAYNKLIGGLNKDMDDSIKNHWQTAAQQAIQKANHFTMTKLEKYDNKLAKDLLAASGDPEIAYKGVMDKALSNPEEAAKFINATGDKREIGAEFVSRAFRAGEGPNGFSGDSVKQFLLDNKDTGRSVLRADQRAALDHLSTVMKFTQQGEGNVGRAALYIKGGTAMLSMSAGAAAALSGKDVPSSMGYAGSVLVAIPLAGAFAKKVLLNPTNARKLALLAKSPRGSIKANAISKYITATLKGAGSHLNPNYEIITPEQEEQQEQVQ